MELTLKFLPFLAIEMTSAMSSSLFKPFSSSSSMVKRAFSITSQAVSSRGGRECIFFADPCCVDGDTISSLVLFCYLAAACELVASARSISRQPGHTL